MMTALLDGSIAGAGFKEALFRRFEKDGLHLLRTSDPVPNFAFAALPSQPPAFRERLVAALMKLHPRENAADAATVKAWDDEVKNGFMLPGPDFLPAVRRLHQLSRALAHEDR
jgi:ABC-type phosphate/phosphonate transport system substrate-binding protein